MSQSTDLLDLAQRFASDIVELLEATLVDQAPLSASTGARSVIIESQAPDGSRGPIPLQVKGEHRLDLRLEMRCRLDKSGRHLALANSKVWLQHALDNNPLIRFEYDERRRWADAHVQVHAESAALGWLHAYTGKRRPPRVQELHIPVGGKRFRPTLEDVIEFAVHDLAVDAKRGWQARVDASRAQWVARQTAAAARDWLHDDPDAARPALRRMLDLPDE